MSLCSRNPGAALGEPGFHYLPPQISAGGGVGTSPLHSALSLQVKFEKYVAAINFTCGF